MQRGKCVAIGFSVVTLLWVAVSGSHAQQQEIAEAGKVPYQQYCAVCHGLNGKGNGDMATLLKVKPANLTQLSAKNWGVFPFWQVYRIVDGREEIRGHGSRDMPIWGTEFKRQAGADPASELQAHARIIEIVYYIESLQAPTRRSR
jgi:mono/diheme cytochrome c family protein